MKYKLNLDVWKESVKVDDTDGTLRLVVDAISKLSPEKLDITFSEKDFEGKACIRYLVNLPAGSYLELLITKEDCDIIDEKIITEEEYNFLKAIEEFLERKIYCISKDSLSRENDVKLKQINFEIERKSTKDDTLDFCIYTTKFDKIKEGEYWSRNKLVKGWEDE